MKYEPLMIANPRAWAVEHQESIFEYYLGLKVGNKLIRSPFREDRKPTCGFYYSRSNRLYLHDFATDQHMDCIEIVKLKFGINYRDAINKILSDRDKLTRSQKIIREEKHIEFIMGDLEFYKYFYKFHITIETLTRYQVFPAKVVYANEEIIARGNKSNPLFAYVYPSGNIKTYRPLSKDSTKKWGGNAKSGDIAGMAQLPKKGQILFITSSLKDVMVLQELGYNAIAFNGEGYGMGNGESAKHMRQVLNKLEDRYEHIIFYMNNDAPGMEFNQRLAHQYRKKFISNPPKTPKDISDYVQKKGAHNGKRLLKKLLSKIFRHHDDFISFAESLDTYQGLSHNIFTGIDSDHATPDQAKHSRNHSGSAGSQ